MYMQHHAFLLGLLHEIHSISFRVLDGEGIVEDAWIRESEENPVGPSVEALMKRARKLPGWGRRPVVIQSELSELYLALTMGVGEERSLLAEIGRAHV